MLSALGTDLTPQWFTSTPTSEDNPRPLLTPRPRINGAHPGTAPSVHLRLTLPGGNIATVFRTVTQDFLKRDSYAHEHVDRRLEWRHHQG